jgi:hypothetical protein
MSGWQAVRIDDDPERARASAAPGEVRAEYREALRADPDLGPLSGGA